MLDGVYNSPRREALLVDGQGQVWGHTPFITLVMDYYAFFLLCNEFLHLCRKKRKEKNKTQEVELWILGN